jgi:hypothetical protein
MTGELPSIVGCKRAIDVRSFRIQHTDPGKRRKLRVHAQ